MIGGVIRGMAKTAPGRTLALAAALSLAGCGTLLYPDRHGQRGGYVDPAVVLLDGALLLLYVIPGLIAFGIDFHTGAIYLPARRHGAVIEVPPEELDAARIREVVRAHTGVDVAPEDPRLQVERIGSAAELRARVVGAGS